MDEPRNRWPQRIISWTLVALLAAFAFWAVLFPLTNTDIWWHLSAGRHMVEHGSFLYEDPFSYASEGARWIDLHWLFQLSAYLVHSVAGVEGLVLVKALVFAGSCLVLVRIAHRDDTLPIAVALCACAVYFMRFLVLARPIVASLLYLAVFVFVLERFRRAPEHQPQRSQRAQRVERPGPLRPLCALWPTPFPLASARSSRILWVLPAVQVLWTNTQGLFVLGPVTLACYLIGDAASLRLSGVKSRHIRFAAPLSRRDLRTLLFFFLGTCAACLVSPYGPWGLALPGVLFSRIEPGLAGIYARNIAENLPSWIIQEETPGRLAYLEWFGLITLGSFVLARRRLSLARFGLFVAYLYLGIIAKRNLSLYLFVAVPVTMANLRDALEGRGGDRLRALLSRYRYAGVAAALVVMGLMGWGLVRSKARDPSALSLAPFRYPVEATDILEAGDFEGNVFNSVRYGGYLIWRLYPQKKVFIDGRLVIRSRETFGDYLRLLAEPARFEGYRERYNITRAVLPTAAPRRHLGLVGYLYAHRDWDLAYADGASALFEYDPRRRVVRTFRGPDLPGRRRSIDLGKRRAVAGILAEIEHRHGGNAYVLEEARINVAVLLLHLGLHERAGEVLAPLPSANARRYLARSRYLEGRPDEAEALCEELLAEDGEDTSSLNLLGRIHLDRGEVRRALELFRATIEIDPFNRFAGDAVRRIEEDLLRRRSRQKQPQMNADERRWNGNGGSNHR